MVDEAVNYAYNKIIDNTSNVLKIFGVEAPTEPISIPELYKYVRSELSLVIEQDIIDVFGWIEDTYQIRSTVKDVDIFKFVSDLNKGGEVRELYNKYFANKWYKAEDIKSRHEIEF